MTQKPKIQLFEPSGNLSARWAHPAERSDEGSQDILPRSQLSLKCMDEADYVLVSSKILMEKQVRYARQDEGS